MCRVFIVITGGPEMRVFRDWQGLRWWISCQHQKGAVPRLVPAWVVWGILGSEREGLEASDPNIRKQSHLFLQGASRSPGPLPCTAGTKLCEESESAWKRTQGPEGRPPSQTLAVAWAPWGQGPADSWPRKMVSSEVCAASAAQFMISFRQQQKKECMLHNPLKLRGKPFPPKHPQRCSQKVMMH